MYSISRVTIFGMGFDYDRLRSVYCFNTYCVCGGYYMLIASKPVIVTNPPQFAVVCKICNKKALATMKEPHEDKAKTL